MALLSEQQKQLYRDQGYLVVKRHVTYELLAAAREAALRVARKCAYGDFPYCRADKRLSDRFIEKIDHIFHPEVFEKDILDAVLESKILDYAKEAVGHEDVFVSFYRLHVTQAYSAWSAWHRDGMPDARDFTIKATLPLFNECGFFVVPGSHRPGDTSLHGTNSKIRGHLPGEVRISVEAGDILLFHPSISHRASCAGRGKYQRAQVHFRVTASAFASEMPQVEDFWSRRPELLAMVDEPWRDALSKDLKFGEYYKITERGAPTKGMRGRARQLLARAFYYASALLPADHRWMSEPPENCVPFVRVPADQRYLFER